MDEYMSEKEQVEALRQWWKDNGRFVITGLVVGIAGVVGWQQWQLQKERVAQSASDSFVAVQQAAEAADAASVASLSASLRETFPRSPYAVQATLLSAKAAVDDGDLSTAAAELTWAMENANDQSLSRVARLRLARVQLALGEIAAAEATLDEAEDGAFGPLFDEVRGDIAYAKGDLDSARSYYQAALDNMEGGVGDRQSVEMKLHDVTLVSANGTAEAEMAEEEAAGSEADETGADG